MTLAGSILFAASEGGRWRPGIGDPTVLGWVTVVAYLAACIGCALAAIREPMPDGSRRPRGRPSQFWLILSGLLLALGINKQLDLQSLVTQIGRDLAKAWGLYSDRRELQLGFIAAVVLVCAATAAALLWLARRTLRRRWPAVLGMSFILGFVVIRAASFHNIDAFLGTRLGGLRWNWILELGGISIVAAAAARVLFAPPGRPARADGTMTYGYRINS
jgi:hypothetical protein